LRAVLHGGPQESTDVAVLPAVHAADRAFRSAKIGRVVDYDPVVTDGAARAPRLLAEVL
jgi:hypothetical protein